MECSADISQQKTFKSTTCNDSFQDSLRKRMNKKRVRFDDDQDLNASSSSSCFPANEMKRARRLEVIKPTSEMSEYEKESRWYSKSHFQKSLESAQIIAIKHGQNSSSESKYELDYRTALASTYASCHLDDSEDSALPEYCAQYLVATSSMRECPVEGESNRGLERITVPQVGMETIRRRKEAISSVLLAQCALSKSTRVEEKTEFLRLVSEDQTKCARKFAKALGTADAMCALLEYQASSSSSSTSSESEIPWIRTSPIA